MPGSETDPLARKAEADLILERAASQLRRLLREAAAELRPFPPFPGAFFTNAIEVEPEASASSERGCVVVCEDGELYELQMEVDFSKEFQDPVSVRDETLKPLEDLHPRDYVVYAYNALVRISEFLLEQQGEEAK